tara:strand:- start:44 stop:520 length:477 start_codon:yes stop_codon:yes gene_type:complete
MGLPSSGTISANMINAEVSGRSATANAPLSGTSSTPQTGSLVKLYVSASPPVNQIAPHAYSEFYGRSFVSTTPYNSSTVSVFNGVCPFNGSNPPASQQYHHNGSGTLPAVGNRCFSDAAGTSALASGYYYLTGTGSGNRTYIQLDNNGDVLFGYPTQC